MRQCTQLLTLSLSRCVLDILTIHPVNKGVPPTEHRVLKVLYPFLEQLKSRFHQHILTGEQLGICECFRVVESPMLAAREVFEEHGQKCSKSLGCIALAPICCVEHVAYLRGADGTDQANNTRASVRSRNIGI